jgi:hypothetical protein
LVRNHIGCEELGIPGVSIVQEGFVNDALATGEAFRLENPAMAVMKDVLTSLNAELAEQAVEEIIEAIIAALTTPRDVPEETFIQRVTTLGPKEDVLEYTGSDYRECFEKMNEAFLDWGWSDGFPLIPPTEDKVEAMLKGTHRPPDDIVIEKFVPGMAQASVKSIAVNAVMAGCNPEFLPVVITAIEAMHDPVINLRVVTMSTGPHAPLFIVNGPIAKALKINSGMCALGNAGPKGLSFPNVVIGRAVRLALMNIGNSYPGVMDQDTIGTPAKFSMVLAENEDASPWEPYHVEYGFSADDNTVSCCYGHSLVECCDLESDTAEGVMNTFARHLKGIGGISLSYYSPLVLIAPDHATILKRDGWTKDDIRKYLHLHCTISAEEYRRSACTDHPIQRKWIDVADSKARVPLYESHEDIQIVVVGGMAGKSAGYVGIYPANPHPVKN